MEFDLDQGIDLLSRTPDILRAWLHDLPDAWVCGNEGEETWSPDQRVVNISRERAQQLGLDPDAMYASIPVAQKAAGLVYNIDRIVAPGIVNS